MGFLVLSASACAEVKEKAGEMDAARERMMERDLKGRDIRDETVLAAMRKTPRHEFVPAEFRREAYGDYPLPIGDGQTISQPYIVALMTELAALQPDSVALEVGTGSGYQAAVLAEIAARVYTIEIVPELAKSAVERLARLGYTNVVAKAGDGYAGWAEHAPFDAILVTAAPDHVPAPLVEQLKPGGRLVLPVGPAHGVQELDVVTRQEDGSIHTRRVIPVRFVPLTGEHTEQGLE